MRIIAGELGGRSLKTLTGAVTRPAMGRTREALFSMLEARGMAWAGKRVLDLFSGCGSLALEALSRGADWAMLVDNSSDACRCIAANIATLELDSLCRVVDKDVKRVLAQRPPMSFDMVFIDPPYGRNYVPPALHALARNGWIKPGTFISAEMEKNAECPLPRGFIQLGDRLFGQTRVFIWQYKDEEDENSSLPGNL